MLNKLTGIQERYQEINQALMEVGDDYQRATELSIERSELEPLINKIEKYRQALESLEEAKMLLDGDDPDLAELAEIEISEIEERIPILERDIKTLLLPKDPRDDRNVIVEIRAGAGGDEAGLFAAELYRMYSRYSENRRWKVEIISANETGVGGFKEVAFEI